MIVSKEEIDELMEYVSSYSLYAFEEEMKQGFITVGGGHRVGMAGQAIIENGKVKKPSLYHFFECQDVP